MNTKRGMAWKYAKCKILSFFLPIGRVMKIIFFIKEEWGRLLFSMVYRLFVLLSWPNTQQKPLKEEKVYLADSSKKHSLSR